MKEGKIDELLELIWTMREEGNSSVADLLKKTDISSPVETLQKLLDRGMAKREQDRISLTPAGEEKAEGIIRRHRLAERLFHDVFDLKEERYEHPACGFEHVLSEEVAESICTFLGHPPCCPHGKQIPKGRCCMRPNNELKPIVRRLTEVEPGRISKIVFIVPKSKFQLDRISVLGIVPGENVAVKQKQPSYVIQVGATTVALDREIANEIYVK